MNSSKYLWFDASDGRGRNLFAFFRRVFSLPEDPSEATFRLFADSLYRLTVNGEIAGYGPARFNLSAPQYDSYDLRPFLKAGENEIVVEVNSRGAYCFQAALSRGGFIAGGQILAGSTTHDLATPGGWEVHASVAWDADAEPFSFAQGPTEILDRRRLPRTGDAGAWSEPVVIAESDHWGRLAARDLRMPSLRLLKPVRTVMAATLRNGMKRAGFRSLYRSPEAPGISDEIVPQGRFRQPFFTHLWSPVEQECNLGLFWGPIFLNGKRVHLVRCPVRGNRENARVSLKEGWNFIYGAPELLKDHWPWLMEFPDNLGLRLAALPSSADAGLESKGDFFLGPIMDATPEPSWTPGAMTEIAGFPEGWSEAPGARRVPSPGREIAWDLPGEPISVVEEGVYRFEGDGMVVIDMGVEFLGHAGLTIDSPEGTVVDIAYQERLDPLGRVDSYRTNPFVNAADRFITSGTPSEGIEAYHERGGRYLQITIRDAAGPVTLREIRVRESAGNYPEEGSFSCDDPFYNWLWKTGIATLQACSADGWFDCPWRERGIYLADCVVAAEATRAFTRDWRMEPWVLRLWVPGQTPEGYVPSLMPIRPRRIGNLDFSLLYILLLKNAWAATGDADLVRELWPVVKGILSIAAEKPGTGGLWEVRKPNFSYIDWGAPAKARCGVSSALNAFRIIVLEAAVEMASAIGRCAEASEMESQAAALRDVFHRTFWMPAEGRYLAAPGDLKTPSWHATALALYLKLPVGEDRARCVEYLRDPLLRVNSAIGSGIDLYFLYYTLEGLASAGAHDLAERAIRSYYGIMYRAKAWTLWESITQAISATGSLCHAWACTPMVYFHRHILGCSLKRAGNPDHVRIAPVCRTLSQAKGEIPHPRGTIRIAWRRTEGHFHLEVSTPEGVTCEFDLNPEWSDFQHEILLNGKKIIENQEALREDAGARVAPCP